MAIKVINTAATTNVKQGTGRVYSVYLTAVGTGFTIQLKDGPDSAGNTQPLFGSAAFTPGAQGYVLNPNQQPVVFRDGLQVVTTGTPGEYEIQYD